MSALLEGVKVIGFEQVVGVPASTAVLADWGADVIRIEPPSDRDAITGDGRHGPDFQNLHRNKRAMTLNLKSEEGKEVFFELSFGH